MLPKWCRMECARVQYIGAAPHFCTLGNHSKYWRSALHPISDLWHGLWKDVISTTCQNDPPLRWASRHWCTQHYTSLPQYPKGTQWIFCLLMEWSSIFTLKFFLVAFSADITIAIKPFDTRSSTFTVPRRFKGVTTIWTPPLWNKRGIQKVRVFPEPVAAILITSRSCFRIASTTWICHRHR